MAFSRPWAILSVPWLYQAPLLLTRRRVGGHVEDFPFPGQALAEDDIKLRLPEGRRQLVFHHLHPGAVADDFVPVLDGREPSDIHALGGVEFQGVAAGGGFGVAEHHPDLHADLVDEDHAGLAFVDGRGEFAQGLAHEPRLGAHLGVPHVSFDFGAGHQGRHRVHHHDVDGVAAHQDFGDLHGLLAGVGLGDEQILGPDPQFPGVMHVQGVLGVDEGRHPAQALGLGDGVQGQGGLPRRFRPVDLDDPAPGNAADPQGQVQAQGAGGDDGDLDLFVLPQAHDGALAVMLFDLPQRLGQGLVFFGGIGGHGFLFLHLGFPFSS